MTTKIYHWDLHDSSAINSLERYCHNCGRKVMFTDSRKRRRNANGKAIYEYAIYKCEQGHTWNMPVGIYKATQIAEHQATGNHAVETIENEASSGGDATVFELINLEELKKVGVTGIEIILGEVTGRWRIDKLLGERIRDISRSKVCELIHLERVFVDGKVVKRDFPVRNGQKISILL